jgi:hypothetical protein
MRTSLQTMLTAVGLTKVKVAFRVSRCVAGMAALCTYTLIATRAGAQTNPIITAFESSGTLGWSNVVVGHEYAIQSSTVLVQAWTNLGNGLDHVQSTDATMTVSVPIDVTQKFYRVVDATNCCHNNAGATYATALYLGAYCDTGGVVTQLQSGCGNAWYRLYLQDCSGPGPRARVTISSPTGMSYAIYGYLPGPSVNWSAIAQPGTSTNGAFEIPTHPFVDDSTDVYVEVRRISGYNCSSWNLIIAVNAP